MALREPRLGVSIVLYNTPEVDIENCICSLSMFAGDLLVDFIDHSPSDRLRKIIPFNDRFRYTYNPQNPGYGAGHNNGLRSSLSKNYDYHLVLNADISFDDDVISPILAFMDANPNVANVMPKVLNPDGTIQRLCKFVPTPADLFTRRFLPKSLSRLLAEKFTMVETGYDKIMFVPYLSGCFMMLRVDALRVVGLFDERFFLYPEDIDLSRRLAAQFDTFYFPLVRVFHRHDAASHKSVRMMFIHIFNMIKYFNKWGWFFDSERRRLNRRARNFFL